LLDVGGNTGRWALRCVNHDPDVRVTIMDLPQQIELMKQFTAGKNGADRINGHGCNLLDKNVPFPTGFDVIWLSQFLDCFSEEEVTSILTRAAASMNSDTKLYIMETFWDRQRFETAAYALTQISLYFTALANGNSKMYHSEDMIRCIEAAGLKVEEIKDGIGKGHSIVVCRKIDIKELLPQQAPFIMLDALTHFDKVYTSAMLKVTKNNIFVENNEFTEAGIMENIAQTCAARMGYINKYLQSGKVKIGFIGAIKNLVIEELPRVGDELKTTIEVFSEIFAITLVNAKVEVADKLIASCEMKIAITDMDI
jgi:3-hydroxymyristoyl/3-hydroxydecanoyl-(acyl carrier protein) dehydratase